MPRFLDRQHAGRELASLLRAYANQPGACLLALPRGGVPVAFECAQSLHLPLDVIMVRKLVLPEHPEYAVGAVASPGIRVLDPHLLRRAGISDETVQAITQTALEELRRREHLYRGDRPPPDLKGRIAILVDDGLATGYTMRAAVRAVRRLGPARVVVAVPVASRSACEDLRSGAADELQCLWTPDPFTAVSLWYERFEQTSDEEVCELLLRASLGRTPQQGDSHG